jgi:hypothetical protein
VREPRWHVAEAGKANGPYTSSELQAMVAKGSVTPDTLVWTPGSGGWTKAGQVAVLSDVFEQTPPPPPAA